MCDRSVLVTLSRRRAGLEQSYLRGRELSTAFPFSLSFSSARLRGVPSVRGLPDELLIL